MGQIIDRQQGMMNEIADKVEVLCPDGSEQWRLACKGIAELLRAGWPYPQNTLSSRIVGTGTYRFRRFSNGVLMAEHVRVKASSPDEALEKATALYEREDGPLEPNEWFELCEFQVNGVGKVEPTLSGK